MKPNTVPTMKTQIMIAAGKIAGALWDDREKTGTLADQLRTVAASPDCGTDCDLTDADRTALRSLATEAEAEL